jgi:hypothetical protein
VLRILAGLSLEEGFLMNERRTTISILQRLPLILAVTAASYGLPLQSAHAAIQRGANAGKSVAKPAAATSQRHWHDQRLVRWS